MTMFLSVSSDHDLEYYSSYSTVVLQSTYRMYAFPTRFMLCMMYAFLNRPFYTWRINLDK